MTKQIWVSFTQPGFHCWPEAPVSREYLSWPHRHLFYVKVTTKVEDSNREVEFHDLLAIARPIFKYALTCKQVSRGNSTCTTQSCEQLAEYLLEKLDELWPNRQWIVIVSEDNECGATIMNS